MCIKHLDKEILVLEIMGLHNRVNLHADIIQHWSGKHRNHAIRFRECFIRQHVCASNNNLVKANIVVKNLKEFVITVVREIRHLA